MNNGLLFSGPALRVTQPVGDFWVAAIPAAVLLEATLPDRLRLLTDPAQQPQPKVDWELAGALAGTQRKLEGERLKQIAAFIDTLEATFPNSIILAVDEASANEDALPTWTIVAGEGGQIGKLSVPQGARKARVVDGQHRLYAFTLVDPDTSKNFELLCAVFFGIPDPMQAFIFATINTNQKPVRRGMAMNLYGYNVEDRPRSEWSPEKLAVFMARRLNFEEDSALYRRVKIEAEGAPVPELLPGGKRPITMAAVVDVVLGLVSRNPKRDRELLASRTGLLTRGKRTALPRDDRAPLRNWYVDERDADIYALLKEFFRIVNGILWSGNQAILIRAVDIRALGDFLGDLLRRTRPATLSDAIDAVRLECTSVFRRAREVSFGDPFFEATYRGRRRVENALRLLAGEPIWDQLTPNDRPDYERLLGRRSR